MFSSPPPNPVSSTECVQHSTLGNVTGATSTSHAGRLQSDGEPEATQHRNPAPPATGSNSQTPSADDGLPQRPPLALLPRVHTEEVSISSRGSGLGPLWDHTLCTRPDNLSPRMPRGEQPA